MRVELTEAIWLDERGEVTLVELAECSGLAESELRELVELGALTPRNAAESPWHFTTSCITAARLAGRLRTDFELDAPGLALVLSLLERVQSLEKDLQRLQARLPRSSSR